MTQQISSIDSERVKAINSIMDEMYSYLPNIYESLVDKDIEESKKNIVLLIDLLKTINESMEYEI